MTEQLGLALGTWASRSSYTIEIPGRNLDQKQCRIVVSVSGGKDSAAVSLLLQERGIQHERVFMDTGWEHPATYEYLRGPLTDKLGAITEIRGQVDFVDLVRKKRMFPSRVMRFCTTELKVLPIQRYLREMAETEREREIVNVVGIRQQESQAPSKMGEWEFADSFDVWVWRPIIEWKTTDVVAIHERHGLPMNPLYGMGATRVGCWPCIHARKSELALVARIDPERINLIRALEAETQESGEERDRAMGREYLPRTMFWWHPHRGGNVPIKIDDAIAWAQSKRGEWQPKGAGDGCARHGMCSVEPEDATPTTAPGPDPVGEALVDQILDVVQATAEYHQAQGCACADCGHEQPTMDPCAACGSVRVALISVIERTFGASWRDLLESAVSKRQGPLSEASALARVQERVEVAKFTADTFDKDKPQGGES